MDKEELLHRLRTSGEAREMSDSANWKAAFDLYYKATGIRLKTEERCTKCFNKVMDWLEGKA